MKLWTSIAGLTAFFGGAIGVSAADDNSTFGGAVTPGLDSPEEKPAFYPGPSFDPEPVKGKKETPSFYPGPTILHSPAPKAPIPTRSNTDQERGTLKEQFNSRGNEKRNTSIEYEDLKKE